MKRSGALPRKRAKKRRTLSPRCTVRGCTKIARVQTWCRTHAIAECDRRARAVAFRAVSRCTACGSTEGLQWSHHLSRRFLWSRWLEFNSTVHCVRCHKTFTENPALHTEWIIGYVGEDVYAVLLDAAYGPKVLHGFYGEPMRTGAAPMKDSDIEVWLSSLPPVEEAA